MPRCSSTQSLVIRLVILELNPTNLYCMGLKAYTWPTYANSEHDWIFKQRNLNMLNHGTVRKMKCMLATLNVVIVLVILNCIKNMKPMYCLQVWLSVCRHLINNWESFNCFNSWSVNEYCEWDDNKIGRLDWESISGGSSTGRTRRTPLPPYWWKYRIFMIFLA